jgi:uncharacterized protein with HEPN domain
MTLRIHGYNDIELGIVWKTATVELSTLIVAVEAAISKV